MCNSRGPSVPQWTAAGAATRRVSGSGEELGECIGGGGSEGENGGESDGGTLEDGWIGGALKASECAGCRGNQQSEDGDHGGGKQHESEAGHGTSLAQRDVGLTDFRECGVQRGSAEQ